jgi:arginyl-tRNA synthetase
VCPSARRSFKKAASADLVLNIICSEQDLAQQKVALAMNMLNPAMSGRQYHVSYDLVRLPTGRMSGRRGRYLLADDLYEELKARGRSIVLLCERFRSEVMRLRRR